MPQPTIIQGDMLVYGQLNAQSLIIPASTVVDASVGAGAQIDASKLQHEFRHVIAQEAAANAVAGAYATHVARAAGNAIDFKCGLIVPPDTASGGGGRTATFDVKKNGASILSGVVTLNSTNVAYVPVAGAITTAPFVAGDVFTIVVALGAGSTGSNPKGVFGALTLRELAA